MHTEMRVLCTTVCMLQPACQSEGLTIGASDLLDNPRLKHLSGHALIDMQRTPRNWNMNAG